MKITIDTKEDSHEDIQKVMHILKHIVEKKDGDIISNYPITENKEPADTTNMMSMFADQPKAEEKTERGEGTAPDFSSFLNLANKSEEEKKEEPKVQFF